MELQGEMIFSIVCVVLDACEFASDEKSLSHKYFWQNRWLVIYFQLVSFKRQKRKKGNDETKVKSEKIQKYNFGAQTTALERNLLFFSHIFPLIFFHSFILLLYASEFVKTLELPVGMKRVREKRQTHTPRDRKMFVESLLASVRFNNLHLRLVQFPILLWFSVITQSFFLYFIQFVQSMLAMLLLLLLPLLLLLYCRCHS